MIRKDYERPTMKVDKLQHTQMLMTSRQESQATLQDYHWYDENEGTGVQNYLWNNETEE